MFESLGATFASPKNSRQRNAILALSVIAVMIGGFFLRGENTSLSTSPLSDAVDKMMAQANSRPVVVKPEPGNDEPQPNLVKPINKSPNIPEKQVSKRSSANIEPEPIQRRVVERPGSLASAVVSSEKQVEKTAALAGDNSTRRTTLNAPAPREPIVLERTAENNAVRNKLNVKWEN